MPANFPTHIRCIQLGPVLEQDAVKTVHQDKLRQLGRRRSSEKKSMNYSCRREVQFPTPTSGYSQRHATSVPGDPMPSSPIHLSPAYMIKTTSLKEKKKHTHTQMPQLSSSYTILKNTIKGSILDQKKKKLSEKNISELCRTRNGESIMLLNRNTGFLKQPSMFNVP